AVGRFSAPDGGRALPSSDTFHLPKKTPAGRPPQLGSRHAGRILDTSSRRSYVALVAAPRGRRPSGNPSLSITRCRVYSPFSPPAGPTSATSPSTSSGGVRGVGPW